MLRPGGGIHIEKIVKKMAVLKIEKFSRPENQNMRFSK